MKLTLIKSLILFLSIPIINSLAFGLGTLVHNVSNTTITTQQYGAYQQSMILLISFTALAIFVFEILHYRFIKNNKITTALYVVSFTLMALFTQDQFVFRPLEHSLTFVSIISVVFSRLLLHKKLKAKPILLNSKLHHLS